MDKRAARFNVHSLLVLVGMFCLMAILVGCGTGANPTVSLGTPSASDDGVSDSTSTSTATPASGTSGKPQVEITMQDGGTILIELDATAAPLTVENFLQLVNEGFYDGLTFHRVIPNFMIQGGDPSGNGTGGSSKTIKGEFSKNGVDNPISHKRGVISMARSQSNDSASSQFFITNADSTHLDGQYAAFGHVLEGMDEVDRISSVKTGANDKPTTPVVIKTIRMKL